MSFSLPPSMDATAVAFSGPTISFAEYGNATAPDLFPLALSNGTVAYSVDTAGGLVEDYPGASAFLSRVIATDDGLVDWDAHVGALPAKDSGRVLAKLSYRGRGKLHFIDDEE